MREGGEGEEVPREGRGLARGEEIVRGLDGGEEGKAEGGGVDEAAGVVDEVSAGWEGA